MATTTTAADRAAYLRQCQEAREELATLAAQSAEAIARRKRDAREESIREEANRSDAVRANEDVYLAKITAGLIGLAGVGTDPREIPLGNRAVGKTFFADLRWALRKSHGLEARVKGSYFLGSVSLIVYQLDASEGRMEKIRKSSRSRTTELVLDQGITVDAFVRACDAYDAHWTAIVWPSIQLCISDRLEGSDFSTKDINHQNAGKLSAQALRAINASLDAAHLLPYSIHVYRRNDTYLGVEFSRRTQSSQTN
jgi:hypothetical protein